MQRTRSRNFSDRLKVVSVLFMLCSVMDSQAKDEEPVILEHADSLVGRTVNGESVRELIGNVVLRQGTTLLRCQRAVQYFQTNRIDLEGSVIVTNDTLTLISPSANYDSRTRIATTVAGLTFIDAGRRLTANRGSYNAESEIAQFDGNVALSDSASKVESDQLTYYRKEKRFIAQGNVIVSNPADRVWVVGEELIHRETPYSSRMNYQPVLMRIDTTEKGRIDTLFVQSKMMEVVGDSARRYIARDSVRITRGGLAARCVLAEFDPDADTISLTGNPVLWYERTQARGNLVKVLLHNHHPSDVLILGDAIAISETDTTHRERRDQLGGAKIELKFLHDSLRSVTAFGNAMSFSFLFDEGKPNGVNQTTADRITLELAYGTKENQRQGALKRVIAVGGVQGNYYPENMVRGNVQEYRLPNYFWETKRPELHAPPLLLARLNRHISSQGAPVLSRDGKGTP
ncbi:MAG: OstA-like protein [Bacteroidota bacterium]